MNTILNKSNSKSFQDSSASDYISTFQNTQFKIAIQKQGELTSMSHLILSNDFKLKDSIKTPQNRQLTYILKNGSTTFGVFLAKNIDLCNLVNETLVDMAIVGADNYFEYPKRKNLVIVKNYKSLAKWPIVVAVSKNSKIRSLKKVKTIVTQYPKYVSEILAKKGINNIKIIQSRGSTEGYLHLSDKIDAIVDFSVTGTSLKDNYLIQIGKPLAYVYPVLIAKKQKTKNIKKLLD